MGPLEGTKIVEIAGIGPGQLCGMLLAEMGADVIRIDRIGGADLGIGMPAKFNLMNRSRPSIAVDLKNPDGVALILDLCESADALFEGYRPGVMERLGLGPSDCMMRNGKLVYGRITGWGQTGPLADSAGHDANYLGLVGLLAAIGEKDGCPVIPLNLIADFGGGALYLAMGLLAALLEAGRSGKGQVVDAAMIDGVASMMTMFHGMQAGGLWSTRRGCNLLDGGAPFYRTYVTKDHEVIVVCALERRFFSELIELLQIDGIDVSDQFDTSKWPGHCVVLEQIFATRTRDEWCNLLEGTNACFAPVLNLLEAPKHAHNESRGTYQDFDGITQPGPAPRFSRTRTEIRSAPQVPDESTVVTLTRWGIRDSKIAALAEKGVINRAR